MNNNLQLMDKPETVDQSNVTYALLCTKLETEDFSVDNSFGISAVNDVGEIILSIHDISTNRQRVEDLVGLLNRSEIKVDFLGEILEDFLVDFVVAD